MKIVNYHVEKNFDVYGGRPAGGKDPTKVPVGQYGWLGNPFKVNGNTTREQAIAKYKQYFWKRINSDEQFRKAVLGLQKKTVACFCIPKPCHLDVIKAWFDAGCPLKD